MIGTANSVSSCGDLIFERKVKRCLSRSGDTGVLDRDILTKSKGSFDVVAKWSQASLKKAAKYLAEKRVREVALLVRT